MTDSKGLRALRASICAAVLSASNLTPLAAAGLHTNALVGGGPGQPALLPTGQFLTPLAAPGSIYTPLGTGLRPDTNADANGAVTTALSPDGKTLLVLTSGYNCCFYNYTTGVELSTPLIDPISGKPATGPNSTTNGWEWVFVYDVSAGAPVKRQQIQIPNYPLDGLAWDPSGARFYVSGGQDDRISTSPTNIAMKNGGVSSTAMSRTIICRRSKCSR